MDDVNARVTALIGHLQVTKGEFARQLDISPPIVTHIVSGRNKPGLDLIQRIVSTYPHISPDWLLLGTGNMERATPVEPEPVRDPLLEDFLAESGKVLGQVQGVHTTILQYHRLLLDEIGSLNEMSGLVKESEQALGRLREKLNAVKA